ncbi:uncharacterized protein Z519_09109 [Cladophialophora bantiana CBS 173.52]|uniref:Uncharacterized protein n=1 Tax=Cladophialophora bantiana (strain ATCC 10958 / CBS 173.52 / CDC B-1940 / NIH 8579) TaxID=1442370 RepID=A0A0D2HB53_CLAB1|nr:uncharacterized protein Z519_09109 [Cladophialophora bantiana CBS 173.52]KIW90463.1 hypothetical protein Z519_09109 [Cladophialophora bantiana CBS 173.52]
MATSLKQEVRAATVYTKQSPDRGKGIFAVHDIAPKSEVLFVARPLMVALDTSQLQTRCYYCYSSPGDHSLPLDMTKSRTLKTCSGCKVAKFCGQKCQTRAWSEYHRLECKLYGRLHPRILPSTVRAIVRLLKQHKAHLLPHSEWDQLLALESHQEDLLNAGGKRCQEIFIMMKGIKSYCGTDHSEETILRLACVLLINSFTLTNPTFDSLGLILHPTPALLNHSCDPNVFVRFDIPPVGAQEDFPPYGNISFNALRPIAKDEELTLSYIDTTFPFDKRQEELKDRYFFTCNCSLCSRGRHSTRDSFHPLINVVVPDPLQPATPAIIAEAGDQAEQLFIGLQSQSGLEHTQIDSIKHIMHRLAQTRGWPLHRYPYPQLRQQLLLGLLDSERYSEAFLHSGAFVRAIHPVLYEQEYHPTRIVQMFTCWKLCHLCLESGLLKERGSDNTQLDPRMLMSLSCVMIDDIHRILNEGVRSNGKLENMVHEALQNVRKEGVFWNEYRQKMAETRETALSWIDDQVRALFRNEDVSRDIIDWVFKPRG